MDEKKSIELENRDLLFIFVALSETIKAYEKKPCTFPKGYIEDMDDLRNRVSDIVFPETKK